MIESLRKRFLTMFALATAFGCAGCSKAPSIDIIGSFFPVWLVCLTVGVILTFAVRYLLLRFRIEQEVGPLALFYPCSVILITCLLWLILFR